MVNVYLLNYANKTSMTEEGIYGEVLMSCAYMVNWFYVINACVLRLREADGIEVSNRSVIADSWFEGIRYILGMYKLVLQAIAMIKTGTVGYCK